MIAACVIAYNAEKILPQLLDSLVEHVDSVVVGIDSKTTDDTERIARERGAIVFSFDLNDDFAAARNKALEHLPEGAEWFVWVDTDDVVGSDVSLKQIAAEQPDDVSMVWLPYLYHRDSYGNVTTIFDRERLIRVAHRPKWVGRLHETCQCLALRRMARDERVWIDHKNRVEEGKNDRNLRILHRMVEEDPNDHRAVLYLGYQYFAANDWLRACEWFERFIGLSSPGEVREERWQALVYLSKAKRSLGDLAGSIQAAERAKMLIPWYADPYFELAHSYVLHGEWQKAIWYHEDGLLQNKRAPDRILIQNPLDYDYNPFVVIGPAYYATGQFEKALAATDKALEVRPSDPLLTWRHNYYLGTVRRREAIGAGLVLARRLLDTNEPIKAKAVIEALPAGASEDESKVQEVFAEANRRLAHLSDDVQYENFYTNFEQVAGDTDISIEEHRRRWPRMAWVADRLAGAKKVLEVGIGDAVQSFFLAKHGIQVVGIDIDPVRVKAANELAAKKGYQRFDRDPDVVREYEQAIASAEDTLDRSERAIAALPPDADPDARRQFEEARDGYRKRVEALRSELESYIQPITEDSSQVQFHYAPAEAIPQKIKDLGPFDAVVATEIIEHVPDPKKLLDDLDSFKTRVLLTTPDGAWPGYQAINPAHVRTWSRQELENMVWPRGRIVESHVVDHPNAEQGNIVVEYIPGEDILDRSPVAIYCGPGVEEWGPDQIDRDGLGGSETAVVRLASSFVSRGLRVMVYGEAEGVWDGVMYRKWKKWDPRNPLFLFISWRNPGVFDRPIDAMHRWLWMHDTDAGPRLTPKRMEQVDTVLCLSEWHRAHLSTMYPFIADRLHIIGNGIDPTRFAGKEKRLPRVVYLSSPDRGLEQALTYWPKVRERVPEAELHVFYGWDNYDRMGGPAEQKARIMRLADQPGVVWRGRLGQKELAKELMRSAVMLYPGPHPFNETFCIAALEAQAAGCIPVTRDNGALPETNRYGIRLANDSPAEKWVEAVVTAMGRSEAQRQKMRLWAWQQTWDAVAGRCIDRLRSVAKEKKVA